MMGKYNRYFKKVFSLSLLYFLFQIAVLAGVAGGMNERVQAASPNTAASSNLAGASVRTDGSSVGTGTRSFSLLDNMRSFSLLQPSLRKKTAPSFSVQQSSGQQSSAQRQAAQQPSDLSQGNQQAAYQKNVQQKAAASQYQQIPSASSTGQSSASAQASSDLSSSSVTRFGRNRSMAPSSNTSSYSSSSNQVASPMGVSSPMISSGENYELAYGAYYGSSTPGGGASGMSYGVPQGTSAGVSGAQGMSGVAGMSLGAANRSSSSGTASRSSLGGVSVRGVSLRQGAGGSSEPTFVADGRSASVGGRSAGVNTGSGANSKSGAAGRTENVPSFLQGIDMGKSPEQTAHKPHGTELLGVEPGVTTINDVEASPIWSKPGHREVVDSFLILTYRIEDLPDMPFIQILLKDNIVEGIVMHLKAPRELSDTKLSFEETIKNITPIRIPDRDGGFREIYPEKGLAFVLEKGEDPSKPSSRVTQIIAEPVRASYLLIRAEKLLKTSPQQAYRDAGHAVLHEPGNAAGNWIMASLEYEWGDYQKARQHAIQAVKSDSSVPQYCLTLVKILKELHETEGAFKLLRQTVAACDSDPLLKVEAEFLLGDLYRDDVKPDYEQAIACHRRVLEIAEKYFKVENSEVRIMMKNIARKANIALAVDSARQEGEGKQSAFQYLNAASIIADDLIKKEGSDMTAIWEICLAATEVGLDVPDLKELNAYIQTMKRLSSDFIHGKEKLALSVPTVQWRTGKALHNAMLIYELKKDFKQAVQYGVRAQEYLDESGLKNFTTEDRILVGDIAWHLGRMFQEELDQKKEALKWYGKSTAAYSECQGRVNGKNSAKIGMNLLRVSNGLWRLEKNELGPSTAEIAVKFLDRAVKDGVLESSELLVPYTNLAMMYKKLNKMDLAKKFALEVKKLKE